ncbi:uncharacterized protein HMPREF1541_06070 [Cyphellophora europaea CBS 101466]|uniref:VWFA domain-containing protein n=1 Tax=Cyphellophora europaea (strain CBS 101466) TaxID=1220924 RepID=W2RVW9_CYPE1|nr:uncharacterized protein HMPREF1541_06070 [Cyphellophora europaea CBS 101466]ETN39844.1 hypothetical protein HMPREF1541_06070 [Cyphellophora europaea CBS 101466]
MAEVPRGLREWELQQQLSAILPLGEGEVSQIISYVGTLSTPEATVYLHDLLGDSPEALTFVTGFTEKRAGIDTGEGDDMVVNTDSKPAVRGAALPSKGQPRIQADAGSSDAKETAITDGKSKEPNVPNPVGQAVSYAPPPGPPPQPKRVAAHHHTNPVIDAARIRAQDEQEMQQMLQNLQFQYGIYNSDIEPEHDSDYPCSCPIHQYQRIKWRRYGVQDMWSHAVMYPGEKAYNDGTYSYGGGMRLSSRNPYSYRVASPYGYNQFGWGGPARPIPSWHEKVIHQTIALNNSLNREAQASIDAKEPRHSIWDDDGGLESAISNLGISDQKFQYEEIANTSSHGEKPPIVKRASVADSRSGSSSRLSSFRKSIGIKSSVERAVDKANKTVSDGASLRDQILAEERGRWPDAQWRHIVTNYQERVGMAKKIAQLRARYPIQYLHLLRAGYFEPIPVAWANQASNPLKFSIEAAAGWRGITPAWRGYEDTAEERLYWVLNHREAPGGESRTRLKPDFISAMEMARARMASAVEPPPLYFAEDDTCHVQHTSEGYSKQVMPPPFRAFDRPELPTDDTMILLDVSGSMDFDPVRPVYDRYLITQYVRGTQPKNKHVAKAIIRRFTDAMAQHDHQTRSEGYDLVTFSTFATHIGRVNHSNLNDMWASRVRLGGGTRVMTGWQKCKELHFQKHSESATHHSVYGWQAGPQTPMLRLLLLLDGEATDMDEFELDLLGLSWAHVTIFLVGVEGCPHHHRHANELQRISEVNHHVSFVDAQGNTPERFVTHELLKRHLGYEISMQEFEDLERLPEYSAVA